MKSQTLFLLSVIILMSCHSPVSTTPPKPPVDTTHFSPQFSYSNPLLRTYDQYLSSLDSQDLRSGYAGFVKFQDLFTGQPAEICDTAYLLYEGFHLRLGAAIEGKHEKDTVDLGYLVIRGRDVPPPPLSARLKKIDHDLSANGFAVDVDEGNTYISRSFPIMARQFGPYVTSAMKSWLGQLAKEQVEGFQDDAGLVISDTQLVARTIFWEDFARTHPRFIRDSAAAEMNHNLLATLLLGMDNTPVADDSTLTEYYSTAYQYIGEHFPASKTNAVIAPYAKAWQQHDTAEVRKIKEHFLAAGN